MQEQETEEKKLTALQMFQGSIRYVALLLILAFAVTLTLLNRYVQYPVIVEVAYVVDDGYEPPTQRFFRRNWSWDEVERLIENPDRRPDSIRICEIKGTGDHGEMIKTDCIIAFETTRGRGYWESRVYQFPPT